MPTCADLSIVCGADFTPDARRFSEGKPIELIHGEALIAVVRAVQTTRSSTPKARSAREKTLTPGATPLMHNESPQPAPNAGAPWSSEPFGATARSSGAAPDIQPVGPPDRKHDWINQPESLLTRQLASTTARHRSLCCCQRLPDSKP